MIVEATVTGDIADEGKRVVVVGFYGFSTQVRAIYVVDGEFHDLPWERFKDVEIKGE